MPAAALEEAKFKIMNGNNELARMEATISSLRRTSDQLIALDHRHKSALHEMDSLRVQYDALDKECQKAHRKGSFKC